MRRPTTLDLVLDIYVDNSGVGRSKPQDWTRVLLVKLGSPKASIMAAVPTDPRYLQPSSSLRAPENFGKIGERRSSDAMATNTGNRVHESRQVLPTRSPSGKASGPKTSRLQKVDKSGSIRKSSLRRAKDSTDALRQRSQHTQNSTSQTGADGSSSTREGRQFTVGNVGNNGMIYLRYVTLAYRTASAAFLPFDYTLKGVRVTNAHLDP